MENSFNVEGRIYLIQETKVFSEKFQKRSFVLELTSQWNGQMYSELVTFEATQKGVEMLDYVSVGDTVQVDFVLNGREWAPPDKPEDKKYFNTLKALHVKKITQQQPQPQQTPQDIVVPEVQNVVNSAVDSAENDGLPF